MAVVPLDSSHLYICTIPLVTDTFHWSIVYVDNAGICSCHQWAALTTNPFGREDYVINTLPNGALDKSKSSVVLGYFKIKNFAPPDLENFQTTMAGIFPRSHPTALQNRAAGMTCRTWITRALTTFISAERAQEIEDNVKAHSLRQSNKWATCHLLGRLSEFTCVVEDV
jgi:hypothetical protein